MGNKIILLVEDNPDDVELTIRELKKYISTMRKLKKNISTIEIAIVHDGEEAIDYVYGTGAYAGRDISIMPVVILLDLKLPKLDGLEVLKRLRREKSTKLIPVVILTTSDEEKDIIEGYNLGANSYVRKPVDFSHFGEAVFQLGMYWLLLNEPPPEVASKA